MVASPGATAAGESAGGRPPVELEVSSRVWVTTGHANWNFAGPIGATPVNVLSELRWRGTDAVITELSADLVWQRLVVAATLGRGDIDAGVLPWSSLDLEDRHHLRTDLRQNPSFLSRAEGGFGAHAGGGLAWTWRRLSLEAGWEFFDLKSGS